MKHIVTLAIHKNSHANYKYVSAINSLISGGIEPVNLLFSRLLLTQRALCSLINTKKQSKYATL
jgi:hypothetical protein